MNLLKYIGMDVHKATTVIAVLEALGRVLVEAIIETKAWLLRSARRSGRESKGSRRVTIS